MRLSQAGLSALTNSSQDSHGDVSCANKQRTRREGRRGIMVMVGKHCFGEPGECPEYEQSSETLT